jgi:hypothetical protein
VVRAVVTRLALVLVLKVGWQVRLKRAFSWRAHPDREHLVLAEDVGVDEERRAARLGIRPLVVHLDELGLHLSI